MMPLDNSKPAARRGRKATGLQEVAGLPKEHPMNTVNQTSPGAHGASPPRPSTAAKPARTAGSLSGGRGEAHRAAHVSISPAARAAHADQVAPVSTKNPNPQKQPVRFDDTGNLTHPNPQESSVGPVGWDVGPVGSDVGPIGSDVGPIGFDPGPK